MDKSRFLITGLPRTRTTWITVLLNCLGVDARHERDMYFDSMDEMADWLAEGTDEQPHGLVDGFASLAYPTTALHLFESNPIVFIKRPMTQVLESWRKWSPGDTREHMIEQVIPNYYRFIAEMPSSALIVDYSKLDSYDDVNRLVQFCTNKSLPEDLFHFLNHTKIELHASKCMEFIKKNPKAYIQHVES